MYDLRQFIHNTEALIKRHELSPGLYRRWTLNDNDQGKPNEYGCADAANLMYTIGAFPRIRHEFDAWLDGLQSLQNPDTGMFVEGTHHTIHTTAHCIAAMELFDVKAAHALKGLDEHKSPEAIGPFLDALDWDNPWNMSHRGAGIYAAMVLQGEASQAWVDAYFKWLWEEACPETGFWRRGHVRMRPVIEGDRGVFPDLAGSFHYLFNLEYAKMPLRYPDKMIDSTLQIFHEDLWPSLGKAVSFAEIDWVFCLTRASRQTSHRWQACRDALAAFCDRYIPYLLSLDFDTNERLDDLHALFGAMCCVAELQAALPNTIQTPVPLKLVLDRRPFI